MLRKLLFSVAVTGWMLQASAVTIENVMKIKEGGMEKTLNGFCENSGVTVCKDSDGSSYILIDYASEGIQFVTVPYQKTALSGKFLNGILSMEFKIPADKIPPKKLMLISRNAGGTRAGDVTVELHNDRNGAPGNMLTVWLETGPAKGDLRRIDMPLKAAFPEGFLLNRFVKLEISWGAKGLKIDLDGKNLLFEPDYKNVMFSTPTNFTIGGAYNSPAGNLYIRNVSIAEIE